MKFWTMEWWCGLQQFDFDDPFAEYQRHIDAIRERLPKTLLALHTSFSLHDARLRLLEYKPEAKTLILLLDGDGEAGGLRQFVLNYSDVIVFRSFVHGEQGLPGPHGYGDLGYIEVDVTADNQFEHRLLFSTGIEFQIVFHNFELEWTDAQ